MHDTIGNSAAWPMGGPVRTEGPAARAAAEHDMNTTAKLGLERMSDVPGVLLWLVRWLRSVWADGCARALGRSQDDPGARRGSAGLGASGASRPATPSGDRHPTRPRGRPLGREPSGLLLAS